MAATQSELKNVPIGHRLYRVKRGDTLSHIASRECGNVSLWPRIAEINKIKETPNRPGVYLIFPNEPLIIPDRDFKPAPQTQVRAHNQRVFATDLERPDPNMSLAKQGQADDLRNLISSSAKQSTPANTSVPPSYLPRPLQSAAPAAAPPGLVDRLQDTATGLMQEMANGVARVSFPVGLKTQPPWMEKVVLRGVGPGYKWELAIEGEIKVQPTGNVEWWSDPAGAIEYEKSIKLWGTDQVVNLIQGFEFSGISLKANQPPEIKLVLIGLEVDNATAKISNIDLQTWEFEYEKETQVFKGKKASDGRSFDAFVELSWTLRVTILPADQLQQVKQKFLVVTRDALQTAVTISYGLVLIAGATKALMTIRDVATALANRGASFATMPIIIIVTPEVAKQMGWTQDLPGGGAI